MTRHRLLLIAAVGTATVLTGACTKPQSPPVATNPPAASPSIAATPVDWPRCTNDIAGYSIGYPTGWHTTQLRPAEACTQFHPSAFTIPAGGEYPLTALNAARIAQWPPTPDSTFERTLLWERTTVRGQAALRYETASTGQGLYPEGTRRYGYVIQVGGQLMSVFTLAGPGESRLAAWKAVVDEAAATVQVRG